MRITALKTFVANVSRTNYAFVKGRQELVGETLVFEDGHLLAPAAPGLGVELNEEACAGFPSALYHVPLFDGSINPSGVATGAVTMNRMQR